MSKIISYVLLVFFLSLGIRNYLHNNWNVLRHFGIHKFKIGDCISHVKDVGYGYRIISFHKNEYVGISFNNKIYKTHIKYGHWEEDFFEKVDCP